MDKLIGFIPLYRFAFVYDIGTMWISVFSEWRKNNVVLKQQRFYSQFGSCAAVQLEDTWINIASKQNSHHQIHKIESSRFTEGLLLSHLPSCTNLVFASQIVSVLVKVETITATAQYSPIFCCIIYCLCISVSNSIWSICGARTLRLHIFHLVWTLNMENWKLNTADKN